MSQAFTILIVFLVLALTIHAHSEALGRIEVQSIRKREKTRDKTRQIIKTMAFGDRSKRSLSTLWQLTSSFEDGK